MSTTTSPGPAVGSGASPNCSTSSPPCFVSSTAFMVSSCPLLPLQKFRQERAHPRRLLLLYAMAGAVDQMAAQHPRAQGVLHPLEITGTLICAPILFARDEDRGHVDRPAREQLQFGGIDALRPAPIPLQTALEPVALVFAAVDGEFVLRKPPACR